MQHFFNTEIAKKYDIPTAIILENLYYWIEKNRLNNVNYYNGRYWTYNSKKALSEWFDYMTPRQVDYALKKMIANNLIISGNFNENKYDKTLFYGITDFGYSILQNCKMYNYTNNNILNTTNITQIVKEKEIYKEKESLAVDNVDECVKLVTLDDIATWFDKVYAIYPRKVNKIQAKQTFQHKLLNLDQDEAHTKAIKIYQMLVKQKAEWQKENDGQGRKIEHIPHFSTWLNANVDDSENYKKRR